LKHFVLKGGYADGPHFLSVPFGHVGPLTGGAL
jgi:hypothetical protein